MFGNRVLDGGDMYQSHQQFLDDIASYDHGGESTSKDLHMEWLDSLSCEVLRLDGSRDLSENAKIFLKNITPYVLCNYFYNFNNFSFLKSKKLFACGVLCLFF